MNVSTIKNQIKTRQIDDYYIFTGPEWEVQRIYIKQIARVAEADVALYIAPPSLACEFVNTESETVVNNRFSTT